MFSQRYESLLFSFLMAVFMTGLMSLVITFLNLGIVDKFVFIWLNAYWKAFLIAFPIVLLVMPFVKKFVKRLIREK